MVPPATDNAGILGGMSIPSVVKNVDVLAGGLYDWHMKELLAVNLNHGTFIRGN